MQQIVPAITDDTRFSLTPLGTAALAAAKAQGNAPGKLTADDLRSFLNENEQEARRTRTLANIARRASTLFEDGYTVDARHDGMFSTRFTLRTPKGEFYGLCVIKDGDPFGQYCTCKAFAEYDTCKHLQACQLLLDEETALDAQAEREEEAADYFAEAAAHNALVADYFDEAFPIY